MCGIKTKNNANYDRIEHMVTSKKTFREKTVF